MKTRILAFFLTLCMILSMVPAVAFAEEAPAPSMDAIKFNSSFEEDATIKLDQDLTVALTTAVTGKVTIDLNGFELDGTIVGTEGLTIEVKDSSKTHGTINVAVTNATVLMTQGKIGAATLASKYEINTESDVAANDVTYYGKVWAIGEVGYANLTKALAADVAANTTITYCGTAALTENIVPNKDVIVDVKGAAITFGTLGAEGKNLTIKNAKYTDGVVFAGNVTLDGCSTAGTTAFSTTGAGKLTVANGTHAWLTQELVNDVANKVSVPANAVVINNTVVVPEAGNTGSIVAVIGAKGYDSLSKAIAAWMGMAAKDRTSIDLIADIEGYVEVTGTALVKLNLNGHDVNATFINNGELIVTGTGRISAITNKGKFTLDGENSVITSLTNFDANSVFEMKTGTLDSFGANSDFTKVVVYGGWVANSIYNQDYVDAGSVGYAKDGVVNNSDTHTLVKAAPAVIKNGTTSVKGYTSFALALEDVLAGKFGFVPTIVLNEDYACEADIKIETELVIDLNGKTLDLGAKTIWVDVTTVSDDPNTDEVEVDTAVGKLTITDSSETPGAVRSSVWALIPMNNAEVTLENGVNITSDAVDQYAPVYMLGGKFDIKSAKISVTASNTCAFYIADGVLNVGCGDEKCDNSCVEITSATHTAISAGPYSAGYAPVINIYCGEFTGGAFHALFLSSEAVANIYGGEFTSDGDTVQIADGSSTDAQSTLKIFGGTFSSTSGKNVDNTVATESSVAISGGTFNNVTTKEAYAEISEYFAEDYATAGDWTFTDEGMTVTKAEYVIAVNDVKYSSWAAAYAAGVAAGSGKPTFVAIDTTPNTIVVYGDIVLDLNGQTLDGLTLEIVKDEDGTYTCNPVVEVLF